MCARLPEWVESVGMRLESTKKIDGALGTASIHIEFGYSSTVTIPRIAIP